MMPALQPVAGAVADLEVRRGPAAIVRMSDIEASRFLPSLRDVRALLADLPELPDRSWSEALGRAQGVLAQVSRDLSRASGARLAEQAATLRT